MTGHERHPFRTLLPRLYLLPLLMAACSNSERSIRIKPVGLLPTSFVRSIQFVSAERGWVCSDHRLWRTDDGGLHWQVNSLPATADGRSSITGFHMFDTSTGWLLYRGLLYRTIDSGKSWQPGPALPTRLVQGSMAAVWFEPSMRVGWAAGGVLSADVPDPKSDFAEQLRAAIFQTSDGGSQWTEQVISAKQAVREIEKVFFAAGSTGLAFSRDAVFVTVDTGRRWEPISLTPGCTHSRLFDAGLEKNIYAPFLDGGPIEATFVGRSIAWIADNNGYLLQTRDGGKTWCDVYPPLDEKPDPKHSLVAIGFNTESTGWAMDVSGRLLNTVDEGRRWRPVPLPGPATEVTVLGHQTAWVAVSDRLFRIDSEPN